MVARQFTGMEELGDAGVLLGLFDRLQELEPWRAQSRCRGMSPSIFFLGKSPSKEEKDRVRRVCSPCPVREQCADHAARYGEHGWWGGRPHV